MTYILYLQELSQEIIFVPKIQKDLQNWSPMEKI
jgi:hypothetical protein